MGLKGLNGSKVSKSIISCIQHIYSNVQIIIKHIQSYLRHLTIYTNVFKISEVVVDGQPDPDLPISTQSKNYLFYSIRV